MHICNHKIDLLSVIIISLVLKARLIKTSFCRQTHGESGRVENFHVNLVSKATIILVASLHARKSIDIESHQEHGH